MYNTCIRKLLQTNINNQYSKILKNNYIINLDKLKILYRKIPTITNMKTMTAYLSTKSSEQQIAPNNILSITSKALLKLKNMLEEYKHKHNKKYVAIRLTLLKSGCSGYSYKLLFDDLYNNTENQTKNKECLINFKDESGAKNIEVPIIIESNSLTTLFGTKIDFIENELDSQFTFYNKLHIGCCDCGKSYMFEDNKENIHHNIKTNYITKNNFVECI